MAVVLLRTVGAALALAAGAGCSPRWSSRVLDPWACCSRASGCRSWPWPADGVGAGSRVVRASKRGQGAGLASAWLTAARGGLRTQVAGDAGAGAAHAGVLPAVFGWWASCAANLVAIPLGHTARSRRLALLGALWSMPLWHAGRVGGGAAMGVVLAAAVAAGRSAAGGAPQVPVAAGWLGAGRGAWGRAGGTAGDAVALALAPAGLLPLVPALAGPCRRESAGRWALRAAGASTWGRARPCWCEPATHLTCCTTPARSIRRDTDAGQRVLLPLVARARRDPHSTDAGAQPPRPRPRRWRQGALR